MDEAQIGSVLTAPPPPSEVKIRTMRSDLASMAKTGGGLPQFQNVKVAQAPGQERERVAVAVPGAVDVPKPKKNIGDILLVASLIIVVIALGVVGWFLYAKFSAASQPTSQSGQPGQSGASQSSTIASTSPSQAQSGLVPVPGS